MKKMTERERRLALVAVGLFLVVVLWQGVAKPLRHNLGEVTAKLQERRQIVERANTEAADNKKMDRDIKLMTVRQKALVVGGGDAVPEMIRRVSNAARLAGLGAIDIRPQGKAPRQGYLRQEMQLETKARFPQLKDFLYYLEQGNGQLLIDRVELTSDKGNTDMVQATIQVSAYSLPKGGKK
jgi:type II secretory pathway component PulM